MAEMLKQFSFSMLERLLIAAIAAIITTYVLTQRHEERIITVEKEVQLEHLEQKKYEEEEGLRCAAVEQRLARIETLVEIHMDYNRVPKK